MTADVKNREDKKFAYGIALFYAVAGAYSLWLTLQDLTSVLHSPLRLSLGVCGLADVVLTTLYLYVFLAKSRGAITSLNALMLAELMTHTRMMHSGNPSIWNWISLAIPVVMALVLPIFWKESGKQVLLGSIKETDL